MTSALVWSDLKQARVSGESNFELEKVATCLDSALNVKAMESQTSVGCRHSLSQLGRLMA